MRALWVCALLLMTAGEGLAQGEATPVPVGTRVRVSLRTPLAPQSYLRRERIVGSLVNLERDRLIVREKRDRTDLSIPIESVRSFEVSRGRKSGAGKGFRIGLLSGAACGVGTALVVCADGDCEYGSSDYKPFIAGIFGLGGALFGAGVGALVGGRIHSDRWEGLPLENLRVGVGPSGDTDTLVRVSATF